MRLFILTLLVAIVRCALVPVNPLCPEPPEGLTGICEFTDANCLSDDTCSGGQICCPHLCGRICKDKISNDVVTNEKCPALDPNIAVRCSITNDQCSGDGECGTNQKCCADYCGKVCKNPVILKPNSCPIIPAGIAAGCLVNESPCTSDGMCVTGKKCCIGLCGKDCVKPITIEIRPGSCSRQSGPLSATLKCLKFDECTHDGDCKNPAQKCCDNGCGKKCTSDIIDIIPITPVKTEKCPALDPNIAVKCSITKDQCSGDGECGPNKKCCTGYYGRVCKSPVILKPNSCPIIPAGLVADCVLNENPCTNDNVCGTDMKCCKGLCNKDCVKPITIEIRPGSCSRQSGPLSAALKCLKFDACTHDGDCKNPTQKCCDGGCGKKCTAAAIKPINLEKPGTCRQYTRRPFKRNRPTKNRCEQDKDCKGRRKCCMLPFGKRCRLPKKPKNLGRCPRVPKPTPQCLIYENGCKRNRDCAGRQRCCRTACGKGCRDGINGFVKG